MRADYCPASNEPCQSLCETPCGKPKPLTDEQIIGHMEAAGVQFMRVYSPGKRKWLTTTTGSQDRDQIIAGVRAALAASGSGS